MNMGNVMNCAAKFITRLDKVWIYQVNTLQKFHISENLQNIITFQFNDFSLANAKSPFKTILAPMYIFHACKFLPSIKNSNAPANTR